MTPTPDPRSENDLWREAEAKAACSCGLTQAGYRAGWAVQHAERCLVTAFYRVLIVKLAGRP
jgi:hypothetical protein